MLFLFLFMTVQSLLVVLLAPNLYSNLALLDMASRNLANILMALGFELATKLVQPNENLLYKVPQHVLIG